MVYTVLWRDPDTDVGYYSLQFDTEPEAEAFKRIIDHTRSRRGLLTS